MSRRNKKSTVSGLASNTSAGPQSKVSEEDAKNYSRQSTISPLKSNFKNGDTRNLIAKLTGVGHLILPKDIKFQKWMISTLLTALFIFSTVANGIVIYGIETVINDSCYSPFNKVQHIEKSNKYFCPSFYGKFISDSYSLALRLFELGSTLHTCSLGIAASGIYYLNLKLILIYIILFLLGLTTMLVSILYEILFARAGLLVYFDLPQFYVAGFLIFFLIDVIHLFATINLEVRWINFLNS